MALTHPSRLLGTPSEETWSGLTQLPEYKVRGSSFTGSLVKHGQIGLGSCIVIQRIKCVGLLIDERFDWPEHINACTNKLTSALNAIYTVNTFLPVSALKTICYTLVYPYLTYGNILWGSTINHI